MNFEPSEDQRAFLDAVEKLAARHAGTPLSAERHQHAPALDADLAAAGFLDVLQVEELGPVAAALMVMALSRLPVGIELTASALVAPWLCPEAPRPAVLLADPAAAVPWLPVAHAVIAWQGDTVRWAPLRPGDVAPVDSVFACPMGRLEAPTALPWQDVAGADVTRLRAAWQLGIACEIVGNLGAAHQAVIEHVTQRRQFGRPLGAFQAVQHRLATCATLIEGARWLALHAACSGQPVDAALACAQAQRIVREVTYDLHQFMGAMGLTSEHPLHRWTYRTRWLQSVLGGADPTFAAVAHAAWPSPQGVCP